VIAKNWKLEVEMFIILVRCSFNSAQKRYIFKSNYSEIIFVIPWEY